MVDFLENTLLQSKPESKIQGSDQMTKYLFTWMCLIKSLVCQSLYIPMAPILITYFRGWHWAFTPFASLDRAIKHVLCDYESVYLLIKELLCSESDSFEALYAIGLIIRRIRNAHEFLNQTSIITECCLSKRKQASRIIFIGLLKRSITSHWPLARQQLANAYNQIPVLDWCVHHRRIYV